MMKKLISFVKPGVAETFASPFFPARTLSREDLPTLDRPINANSGKVSGGHESKSGALTSNIADVMFMIKSTSLTMKRIRDLRHLNLCWISQPRPANGAG